MPKVITSPVKRFPGTVTLKDPIPLDACVEWEAAKDECSPHLCLKGSEIIARIKDGKAQSEEFDAHFRQCAHEKKGCTVGLTDINAQARMLPAIRGCVQEWNIEGFDLANPPGNPKASRSMLVGWLVGEIDKLYIEEELGEIDPNA